MAGQTKSRASGILPYFLMPLSKRTAASITPGKAVRAAAAARHHHDRPLDHTGSNHDDAAIGTALSIGIWMEAWAASAGGIRGAKARGRTCNQSCNEKILHIFSIDVRPPRGTGNFYKPSDSTVNIYSMSKHAG
jgi:hypothetical protein